jgi:signal transduction histidine kinase
VRLVSQMAAQQLQEHKEKEAGHSLEKIVSNTGEMLGKMRDIVWTINPQNDQFETIFVRLRAFAAAATASRGIILHFDTGDLARVKNPHMHLRKNLYLICKEAINNTVKHSDCRNLYFDLSQQDQMINISIRDDGKGFNTDLSFEGSGIKNMYARAKEMKANLQVIAAKGVGSTIMLSLKIT